MVIATFALMGIGSAMLAGSSAWVLWDAIIIFGTGASASTVASETFMAYITTPKDRPMVYGIAISVGLGVGGYLAGFSGNVVDHFGKHVVTGYRVWFVGMAVILLASTSDIAGIYVGLRNY